MRGRPCREATLAYSDSELKAILEIFQELPRVALGEDYTQEDRARDFTDVFLRSEAGQRVLAQICDFCDPPPSFSDVERHGRLAMKEGQRLCKGFIMSAFIPKARIPEVERTPKDAGLPEAVEPGDS